MTLIDLSHTIDADVPRFASIPAPQIGALWTHAQAGASGRYEGCTCEVTTVSMATSIGTYMDSPYHFDPQGPDISALPLQQCVLPGLCLDARGYSERSELGPELLAGARAAGRAVLICTGWSEYWGHERYYHSPFVGASLAAALREQGAAAVGIDTLNIDDGRNPRRPAHVTLLQARIPIIENLTGLDALLEQRFTFFAVPPKIAGAAAFPVRTFAQMEP